MNECEKCIHSLSCTATYSGMSPPFRIKMSSKLLRNRQRDKSDMKFDRVNECPKSDFNEYGLFLLCGMVIGKLKKKIWKLLEEWNEWHLWPFVFHFRMRKK